MLNLPSSVRILYCVVPVDMRRSFDSLAEIVRVALGEEPMSGHLFVFKNKNEDSVKVLYWDRDGYAIRYKRLEKGKFTLPKGTSAGVQIDATTFSMLLHGVYLKAAYRQARYTAPVAV